MEDKQDLLTNKKQIIMDTSVCNNCGGKTVFDPQKQKLKCLYCGSVFDIPSTEKIAEKPIEDLLLNAKPWKEIQVLQCSACGAKEVVGKGQISTTCAFCGSSNVVKSDQIVGMKPQGVCPFRQSKTDAAALAKKWAKGKIFAPNSFKKSANPQNIYGIFSPAFTFDCSTQTNYSGSLAKTESRTRTVNGKTRTEFYTTYYNIRGNHTKIFDDIVVQASENIPQKTLNKLEPFPTADALRYNKNYLSGYSANTYSMSGVQSWQMCKNQMYDQLKAEILRKYHYSYVVSYRQDTNYSNTKFKYVLLPIYVGHHKYKNKVYNFFVNGTTGKVVGDAPVSGLKVLFAVLLSIIVVALIVLLVILFGGDVSFG